MPQQSRSSRNRVTCSISSASAPIARLQYLPGPAQQGIGGLQRRRRILWPEYSSGQLIPQGIRVAGGGIELVEQPGLALPALGWRLLQPQPGPVALVLQVGTAAVFLQVATREVLPLCLQARTQEQPSGASSLAGSP